MIDQDLLDEVNVAAQTMGLHLRSQREADEHVSRIARNFVADKKSQWWWQALAEPTTRISYGDSDGLSALEALLDPEETIDLFVTDDDEPPWPVYYGNASAILSLLRECRFFEFAVAATDASWVIFDTHSNELILAGRKAG